MNLKIGVRYSIFYSPITECVQLWFECKSFSVSSYVRTLDSRLGQLFWKVVELLGYGALLKDTGNWWPDLRIDSLTPLPVQLVLSNYEYNVTGCLALPMPYLCSHNRLIRCLSSLSLVVVSTQTNSNLDRRAYFHNSRFYIILICQLKNWGITGGVVHQ